MRRCAPVVPAAVAAAAVAEPQGAAEPQCAGRRKWTRGPVNLMTHDGVLLVSSTPRMLRASPEQGVLADEVPVPPSSASPTEPCKCVGHDVDDDDDDDEGWPQQRTPVEPFANSAPLDDEVVAHGGGVADVDDMSVVEI